MQSNIVRRLTKKEARKTLRELARQRVSRTPQHADPVWMYKMWGGR